MLIIRTIATLTHTIATLRHLRTTRIVLIGATATTMRETTPTAIPDPAAGPQAARLRVLPKEPFSARSVGGSKGAKRGAAAGAGLGLIANGARNQRERDYAYTRAYEDCMADFRR